MNKKVLAVVAVIALIAILGVCLVACNADDYKNRLDKAGYLAKDLPVDSENVEWVVLATKLSTGDSVTITKFKNTDDAKDAESKAKKLNEDAVYRTGKIVMIGTEQGIKDAK